MRRGKVGEASLDGKIGGVGGVAMLVVVAFSEKRIRRNEEQE